MKLTTLNLKTTPGGVSIKPTISFSRSRIAINDAAIKLLGIKNGSKIEFAQDDDNPKDWYLLVDGADGFPIKINEKNICMYNIHAAMAVTSCWGEKSVKFQIGMDQVEINKKKYYPLLKMPSKTV